MIRELRQLHDAEMCLSVSGGELAVGTKMRAAVLKSVAGFAEVLKAVVERDDAGDLVAHGLARFAAEQVGALRPDGGG